MKFQAIGHGCNCKGLMGSGIARQFADRYPEMEAQYAQECAEGLLWPGDIMPWQTETENPQVIMNLMTQNNPGADARGMWIAEALDTAMRWLENAGIDHLGIPEIGSGIGGLSQDYAHYIFEETAHRFPEMELVVVQWDG